MEIDGIQTQHLGIRILVIKEFTETKKSPFTKGLFYCRALRARSIAAWVTSLSNALNPASLNPCLSER